MRRKSFLSLLAAPLLPFEAAAQVGTPALDIAVSLPNGKSIKLSDYKGKVVSFAFILTT